MSFLRFIVLLPTGVLKVIYTKPTGWTHIVGNYIGPNDGEGVRMFINGAEVASDTTKWIQSFSAGDGRIIIGRIYTNGDNDHASVQVDELIYINAALTSDDVQSIYNSA